MSTSIQNPKNLLPKECCSGSGGGDDDDSGDTPSTKLSIMKYLNKCGLDTSSVNFSLDDVDDSSMALLVHLSRQYAEGGDGDDDNDDDDDDDADKGECEGEGRDPDPAEANSNLKLANEKLNETEITSPKTTIAEKGQTDVVDNKEMMGMGMEALSSAIGAQAPAGTATGTATATVSTDGDDGEVIKILNTVQRSNVEIESESREYEQILAQYSLDSKSFATSKMTNPSSLNQNGTGTGTGNVDGNVEPWVKTLFDKMERQHEHLSKCQEQIQSVARLVAQDMVERRRVMDILLQQQNKHGSSGNGNTNGDGYDATNIVADRVATATTPVNSGLHHLPQMDVPVTAAPAIEEPLLNQQQPPQQPQQPQQSLLFTLLEGFVTRVFNFPNLVMTYIKSTFIARVINLIQTEADEFRRGGALRNGVFLDWALVVKLIFFSFFLFARFDAYDESIRREIEASTAVGSKRARKELEAFNLWVSQRTAGLLFIMVIIYFIQTGAWKFVHRIFIKDNVFRRVWKNEDVENDNNDVNGGNEQNNTPLRRGRRDRQLINRVDDNVNEGEGNHENLNPVEEGDDHRNDAGNNNIVGPQERVRGKLRAILDYLKQQTFLGGHIDRPVNRNINGINQPQVPREQILLDRVIDSVKDVLYLFGSFFLSLFPMWHPRPREAAAVNHNDQNNNNADGDGNGNEERHDHGEN